MSTNLKLALVAVVGVLIVLSIFGGVIVIS